MPRGQATGLPLRGALAGGLALAIVLTHVLLPEANERSALVDEPSEERERLEILDTSPHELYPGGSVTIRYAGERAQLPFRAFAAKAELALVAERPGELIARLPRALPAGPLKLRIAQEASPEQGDKSVRSKPYLVHVKALNLRKLFRHLLGGVALIVLGIILLSRGVRRAVDLDLARTVARFARSRALAYGFGVATGAVLQSTTSAASLLTALHASHLLPAASAGLGLLGAQLGAGLVPLLVAGWLEPREGLLLLGIGTAWLLVARDRRSGAVGRMLLGAGFVMFGLQLFRPAIEPLVSDPVLLAFAEEFSARDLSGVCARALIGALLTAALQGPVGLIVLILGFAQATGRFDLPAALSLLAGSSFGSALAAALTVPGGDRTGGLARLHLLLGSLSSVLAVATLPLWLRVAELMQAGQGADRSVLLARTQPLLAGFGASELARAALLSLLVPSVTRWLARRSGSLARARRRERTVHDSAGTPSGKTLDQALSLQLRALAALRVLVQSGTRVFGQRAEHGLQEARVLLDQALAAAAAGALPHSAKAESEPVVEAALVACAQLQNGLESLLDCAERSVEARLPRPRGDSHDQDERARHALLEELHSLVCEGVQVTRDSLADGGLPDLERARAREIQINCLEARARSASRAGAAPVTEQLQLLRLVDAYETVGNHVYRLLESMTQYDPLLAA